MWFESSWAWFELAFMAFCFFVLNSLAPVQQHCICISSLSPFFYQSVVDGAKRQQLLPPGLESNASSNSICFSVNITQCSILILYYLLEEARTEINPPASGVPQICVCRRLRHTCLRVVNADLWSTWRFCWACKVIDSCD